MMGHKIKVINNPELMTFGLSVIVTKPYNADFDGDILLSPTADCQ
jgi:DNA-directed RNA polymerase beta' subunit